MNLCACQKTASNVCVNLLMWVWGGGGQLQKIILFVFLKQEVRSRLEETAANEEKVSELNRDLSSQMAQMITEFDEDKRQALDK